MKKVPRLRFRGFQEDWELCKLGTLAEIVRGASPRPIQDSKWFDNTSDVGWLRISDVTEQNGRIYKLEQKLSKAGQEKTRVLRKPHLLLSIAATVGKPVVNYVNTGVHDGFLIFLNPLFDREFMFQWLEMFTPKWQKYGQPGSQLNLNSELVRNQELRMPSTNEQEKIGMLFQYLDDTITLHQRKLDQLKELKKAYLQTMFVSMNTKNNKVPKLRFTDFEGDWQLCKLSTEFEKVNERNDGSLGKEHWISVAKMYFQNPDKVQSNNIDTRTYVMRTGDIAFEGHPNKEFKFGRFVANDIGTGVVSELFPIYRHKQEYDNYYWKNAIQIERVMGPIFAKSITSSGNSSNKLDPNHFLRQQVLIPKLEEQKKIGLFLKKIDDIINLHQNKLTQLKSLKKSYLQNMFI
ncbi:restriction endonuclease subunit S [Enterococcus faecalis]|uniref:restriction endonuclease subunit S n=1 Tax=Enterococcus faecalis TaxID=1351 RepID=UPI001F50D187|nr:restriction endonuclease subunit S [Enterococcus faecalis]